MFLDEPTSGLDPVAALEVHNLLIALRERGVTIFLTTHRLEEAEKLCDRVAILNTTLRTVGRPTDLRAQLFAKGLVVKTLAPLGDPAALFATVPSVDSWTSEVPGSYELSVSDVTQGRPRVDPVPGGRRSRCALHQRAAALTRGRLPRAHRRRCRGCRPMIAPDAARVRAVVRKELRDYRRKRAIVVSMAVLPLLFLAEPVVAIFLVPSSGTDLDNYVVLPLLYLLLIPVLTPGTLAAYAVAVNASRDPRAAAHHAHPQAGVHLGQGGGCDDPTLALSYTVFSLFLIAVALFAKPAIASAVFHQGPVLLALFLFAHCSPAGPSSSHGRVGASERGARRPAAGDSGELSDHRVVALLAVGVIHPTFGVAVLFAVVLLAIDVRALRIVARMF